MSHPIKAGFAPAFRLRVEKAELYHTIAAGAPHADNAGAVLRI